MIFADSGKRIRRLVRSRFGGDYVVELHDFYVFIRPYRGRHSSGVAVAWGQLYDRTQRENAETKRAEKLKAKRGKRK